MAGMTWVGSASSEWARLQPPPRPARINAGIAPSGSGARRSGRKNVVHGDSRGVKAGPLRLESPGRGDRAFLIIADRLSPPRGSACSLCAAIPRLGTCEKITQSCHSERSEESAVVCFQKDKSRFFASLRMTDDSFTASGAVGHILAPLMRLVMGRRAYSSAYARWGERAAAGIFISRSGQVRGSFGVQRRREGRPLGDHKGRPYTRQPMKRLIVNADDFGLTAGVNQAIIEAHQDGLISSTSLLANGEAFADAISVSRRAPGLGVGIHLNLTEGKPVAPAAGVHSLINGRGLFARKPAGLWRAILLGRVSSTEIERELRAQIEKVLAAGTVPTHLDSHKHVHALPALGEMSVRLASQYGVKAIRSITETRTALSYLLARFPRAKVKILRQRLSSFALSALSRGWRRRLPHAALACAEHFYGVTVTGFLDEEVLREILLHLPDGTSELMCHPGYVDRALRQTPTRLLEEREREYQALTRPHIKLLARDLGIQLINYGELANDLRCRASVQ